MVIIVVAYFNILTSTASPTHSSIERKKSIDSSGSVLKINLNIEKRFELFL